MAKAATGNEQLDIVGQLDSDELFLCCFIVVDLCSEPCLSQMPSIIPSLKQRKGLWQFAVSHAVQRDL